MRAFLQRVRRADLFIDEQSRGSIDQGLVILLGIGKDSDPDDIPWLAEKILKLRLFDLEDGSSGSVVETQGGLMVISQFTLHASTKKGTKPSYHRSAPPQEAEPIYEQFLAKLRTLFSGPLIVGTFGAHMVVHLENDGPVSLMIDSENRE
ncbi:MAG: D-aminoacyl-tRNA deacylase [Verrucomicrobiota bacterium]